MLVPGDLPLLSSQYRLLCQSLVCPTALLPSSPSSSLGRMVLRQCCSQDWFLASLGHEPSRVFFHACAANQLAESTAMSLERYTATFYADGVTFTSVSPAPPRSQRLAPHAAVQSVRGMWARV